MTIRCCELDRNVAESLNAWTFPSYRPLLKLQPGTRQSGDRRPIRPLAFMAVEDGKPKGLVLGCLPIGESVPGLEMPNEPELLSIYVDSHARRQGIANLLLDKLEDVVAAAGFSHMNTVYMTGAPEIEFLERLLVRRGWAPPQMRMLVLRNTIEEAMRTPWYRRYSNNSEFEYFSWARIDPAELERMKASQAVTRWIANDLVPWYYDMQSLESSSSIGIRYKQEVVGWVINHRINYETVRFTCSFIRSDLARRARLLPAYSESIRRASEAGFKRMLFTVPVYHKNMLHFAERWCAPWATFRGESRGSSKTLVESRYNHAVQKFDFPAEAIPQQ
jgi:GNAT superfamily N-acetyltransferase